MAAAPGFYWVRPLAPDLVEGEWWGGWQPARIDERGRIGFILSEEEAPDANGFEVGPPLAPPRGDG